MNKLIALMVAAMALTFLEAATTYSADLGGQLKLSDNKQVLNEIMNQIKKIATYDFEYTDKNDPAMHYKYKYAFEYSGCKVKYIQLMSYVNDKFQHLSEDTTDISIYNLNNIETIEHNRYNDYDSIVMKTSDFDKKISRSDSSTRSVSYNKDYMSDFTKIDVPRRYVPTVVDLLEKAIKLCADR